MTWWQYLGTQCVGIPRYLSLVFWPNQLVFDYGAETIVNPLEIVLGALFLTALVGWTVWALVKAPPLGFLGSWFFLILAPSSSVLPLSTQTLAEHRMYLLLISIVILTVFFLLRLVRRHWWIVVSSLALLLIWRTVNRNTDYQSALQLWSDTVNKVPNNPRAHNGEGTGLSAMGNESSALLSFERAVTLSPNEATFQYNLGSSKLRLGKLEDAIIPLQRAISLRNNYAKAHNDLGTVLASLQRTEDAARHFSIAASIDSENPMTWMNLGNAYFVMKEYAKAEAAYKQVLALDSNYKDALNNLRVVQLKQ